MALQMLIWLGPWVVLEELALRGFLLSRLRNLVGVGPALTLVAAVSVLVRASGSFAPTNRLDVVLEAILLGLLYVRTGSIWPGYLASLAYAVFAGVVVDLGSPGDLAVPLAAASPVGRGGTGEIAQVLTVATAAVALLGGALLLRRRGPGQTPETVLRLARNE
jgi:hypothetical protein